MKDLELVQAVLAGNKPQLDSLIQSVQAQIYNLAIRFLWNKEDAEDATQEILIKVITNLARFEGKSTLKTWVYRVTSNHLMNLKKTKVEQTVGSFKDFSEDLNYLPEPESYEGADSRLMEREMKTGCTLAMLQCLNRDQREAFILGSALKINSKKAATITDTTPETFRKRLQQARQQIGTFLESNCGVYNPQNKCRCSKRINTAIKQGRIQPDNLAFTNTIDSFNTEMEEMNSMAGIYQNHGSFKVEEDFTQELTNLLKTSKIINYD